MNRAKCLLLAAGLLLGVPRGLPAQLFVEDSEGHQLFVKYTDAYGDRVNAVVNSKDKSLRLRAFWFPDPAPSRWIHAFEVQTKGDGLGSFFSGEEVTPGTGLAYTIGKMRVLTRSGDNTNDWLFLRTGYTVESFDVYDPAATEEQIRTIRFGGLAVTGNYTLRLGGAHLLGFTAGVEERNNASSLREVKLVNTDTVFVDGEMFTTVRERTVRRGEYTEQSVVPVRFAWTLLPSEKEELKDQLLVAPSLYTGIRVSSEASPLLVGGALYLTQANKAGVRSTIGGVFLEARDLLDAADAGNDLFKRVVGGVFVNVPLFIRQ